MSPPPPGEQNGEATCGDPHRSIPTPFLTKTYQLVDDQSIDDVISWNDDGSSFIVWNPTVFARDLLPKYFKHNNFSSFVRQLNTYGFRKVVPDRWEFSNDCFRKGEKKLLLDIQRRKISSQPAPAGAGTGTGTVQAQLSPVIGVTAVIPAAKPITSPSNSGEEQVISAGSCPSVVGQAGGPSTELLDENDRLRKENVQLTKELTEMKHLCNNIYSLVSNFSCSQSDSSYQPRGQGLRAMDFMAVKEFSGDGEAVSARLFGVAIGMKRGREGAGVGIGNGTQADVKSEPYDCQNMDVDSNDRHSLSLNMATHR